MKRPGDLNHLTRLIQQWTRQQEKESISITQKEAIRLVSISVLASILDGLRTKAGEPRLVFKGGASLLIRFGAGVRSTRDLDTLTNISLDQAFVLIEERLLSGWANFEGFIVKREEIVRAGTDPLPQRCKIKLLYKGKNFSTLDFEIGRSQHDLVKETDLVISTIDVDPVLLGPRPLIPLLNAHYQVAQKLHASTKVFDEGSNQRVHDLFDICLLEPLLRTDGLAKTKQACITTFKERKTHSWPPKILDSPEWAELWNTIQVSAENELSYNSAQRRVNQLVADIDNA